MSEIYKVEYFSSPYWTESYITNLRLISDVFEFQLFNCPDWKKSCDLRWSIREKPSDEHNNNNF